MAGWQPMAEELIGSYYLAVRGVTRLSAKDAFGPAAEVCVRVKDWRR